MVRTHPSAGISYFPVFHSNIFRYFYLSDPGHIIQKMFQISSRVMFISVFEVFPYFTYFRVPFISLFYVISCSMYFLGVDAVILGEELLLGKDIGIAATVDKWKIVM